LKAVSGVAAVDVNLEKGLATVKMKPGNAATFRQLQGAITKNGFTMKPSDVRVVGTIVVADGRSQLQVSGSNELVNLVPDSSPTTNVNAIAGKLILVEGILEEPPRVKRLTRFGTACSQLLLAVHVCGNSLVLRSPITSSADRVGGIRCFNLVSVAVARRLVKHR
jgi:hypothetical protein